MAPKWPWDDGSVFFFNAAATTEKLLQRAAAHWMKPTTICEASGGPLVHALSQVAAAGETTTG